MKWDLTDQERDFFRANDLAVERLVHVRRDRYGKSVWAEQGGQRIVVVGARRGQEFDDIEAEFVIVQGAMPCPADSYSARAITVAVVGEACVAELTSAYMARLKRSFGCEQETKKEVAMTEQRAEKGFYEMTKDRVAVALKSEAPTTMWMVAARKAIDSTAPLAIDALVRGKIITKETAKIAKVWVGNEVGSGIYGYVAGTLLTMHPKAAKRAWLAELAKHMRLEGGARVIGAVVDPLLKAVEAVLLGAVEDAGIEVID